MENLGRLVAAERNALAAIERAKLADAKATARGLELERLQKTVAQMQTQIASLNARLAAGVGSGPTSR